ncbi:MAG: endonuclease III [Methanobacteriota archaeon]|nr:MAG: endonuclease III [Euryarchaeota archaeon]
MKEARSAKSIEKKAERVNILLTSVYGRKERTCGDDPLDTLIETILSQNTSDINSSRAFELLKRRYPSWEELLEDSPENIADTIRSGGLAEIKARRILGALNLLKAERGGYDLGFLSSMTSDKAANWLISIEGVGPKTAAIVLLFSFGMPTFPVDTHIFRVSKRLGLVQERTSRESTQKELERLIDPEEYYNMHLNLIEHGRRVCRSRRPRCEVCALSGLCLQYRKTVKA